MILAVFVPQIGSQIHRGDRAMLRSATARGLVYTTSTFESGGTENKILTLSPGCENHQNRPHRDELGLRPKWDR